MEIHSPRNSCSGNRVATSPLASPDSALYRSQRVPKACLHFSRALEGSHLGLSYRRSQPDQLRSLCEPSLCTQRSTERPTRLELVRSCVQASASSTDAGSEKSLFVFGFGYLALGLALLLRERGWSVYGTCRSSARQKELEAQGFGAFLFDTDYMTLGLGSSGLRALRNATHILVSISPASSTGTCPIAWILGREFKHVREGLQWIGFLSTTSVYGDHSGAWVNEASSTNALQGNGFARRQAEKSWLRFQAATGLPVHIFRLAGIYGPGRNAIEAAHQKGLSKRAGKRFTSRCHVFDICQALIASMAEPTPGQIYNVADDDPSSREEVLQFVQSSLLQAAGPAAGCDQSEALSQEPQASTQHAGPNLQRQRESGEKRVSNKKIKQALGFELRFPTYREGLQAIHRGDLTPFR